MQELMKVGEAAEALQVPVPLLLHALTNAEIKGVFRGRYWLIPRAVVEEYGETLGGGLLSVPDLKKRGWTNTLIQRHLGQPDRTIPNPHYRKAAPMRLYRLARVTAVEEADQWSDLIAKATARRMAAARAAETKTRALLAELEGMEFTVPRMPSADLVRKACANYNERREERDDWDALPATPNSDAAFLDRIMVNYLRHRKSRYEKKLEEVKGRVGVGEAYLEINNRIYQAIADAYPELAEECRRQMERKQEPYPID